MNPCSRAVCNASPHTQPLTACGESRPFPAFEFWVLGIRGISNSLRILLSNHATATKRQREDITAHAHQ